MNAADRGERDQKVLQLFLAGATYRAIGAAVDLRSTQSVHRIVQRELSSAARRRALLTDEALAVYQERVEALFRAHWGPALRGDHRSAEICRRLLGQQASLYGLDDLVVEKSSSPTLGENGSGLDDDKDPPDELSRLRAARAGA